MSHTIRDKARLRARIRRIRGQLEGVDRALEAEADCAEVLRQLASIRGAMAGLTAEVIEGHLLEHVLAPETDAARRQGGRELLEVLRTYMK